MINVLAVILVLGGLIFFHELGHFLLARLFGVGVKVFSLGFGPTLWGFKRGQTSYRVSAVPLGGYVSMVGEQPGAELPEGFTPEQSFTNKPAWQRMLIVASGPGFNFLLAFLLYWSLLVFGGAEAIHLKVGEVIEGGPAAEAGIQSGDRVVRINSQRMWFGDELPQAVQKAGTDGAVNMTVRRDGQVRRVDVAPRVMTRQAPSGEEITRPMVGLTFAYERVPVRLSLASTPLMAMEKTWTLTARIVKGIGDLITGAVSTKELGGPIMIAQVVAKSAEHGLATVLQMAAFLSLNLGLINLFPIPVLDGGHIVFFAYEATTGRRVPETVQAIALRIGLLLLLLLMGFAIYNDIARQFTPPA
ncbi:RIP metalloprotease RseP [Desulfohalovibrio reitneri]|uniref:RIP metalloprotease RseP n=1 Tax=Desulfohalovibrio reitneri TaxID=1307759 RepID=UPI0004A730E4|nr:RIP metalloprotease RseP [Desulfohalovibrio reitneri]